MLALVLCFFETDAYCQRIEVIGVTEPERTKSGGAEGEPPRKTSKTITSASWNRPHHEKCMT